MAHPVEHAQNSTRKFGGTLEAISQSTGGLTNPKRSSPTSATAPFVITPKESFWPNEFPVSPSATRTVLRWRSATSENNT